LQHGGPDNAFQAASENYDEFGFDRCDERQPFEIAFNCSAFASKIPDPKRTCLSCLNVDVHISSDIELNEPIKATGFYRPQPYVMNAWGSTYFIEITSQLFHQLRYMTDAFGTNPFSQAVSKKNPIAHCGL